MPFSHLVICYHCEYVVVIFRGETETFKQVSLYFLQSWGVN